MTVATGTEGSFMSAEHEEALEVLRAVWRGNGQAAADLAAEADSGTSCKKMADVSFDDFGDEGADLAAAWRATLAREGKLRPEASTVRDIVLGP
jgi:hypothetical protein